MELDKRIIEGKKPLTCFDAEQARNFVGKKCYLTNDISLFSDLDSFKDTEGCSDAPYVGVIDRLTNINKEFSMVFDTTYLRWKFCIPCEWVTEEKKEPKYRPYTLTEFVNTYSLGDEVIMRSKNNPTVTHVLFVEYEEGRDDVRLGQCWYTFMILFNNYELCTDEGWKPFGVEE